ncbi:GNAT family N-acetyltransferase [Tenggerimyces flavus]|uniref:GNAT family N-acetyltransferase n=1 Tax=Tenggerimyces flavus TaxID=1708749 RepID=A0ABV7YQQ0_9ACTN|nr:GNAT family N-acetyltransferase [Tenggerimyces flavus]MBM7786291.1 RimJ/RimL family protein N-acetyltransferase [Tenggerimyces flavus]
MRLRVVGDLDAIAAASRDEETRRWLDDEPMDEAARASSMERVEAAWRSGTSAPMIVADARTDEAMGLVNLQVREDGTAIAYSVFPSHRGKGVAPRAVELVTGWALEELGLTELLLEANQDNVASIRVAEKCGFEDRGSRPNDDGNVTRVFARAR